LAFRSLTPGPSSLVNSIPALSKMHCRRDVRQADRGCSVQGKDRVPQIRDQRWDSLDLFVAEKINVHSRPMTWKCGLSLRRAATGRTREPPCSTIVNATEPSNILKPPQNLGMIPMNVCAGNFDCVAFIYEFTTLSERFRFSVCVTWYNRVTSWRRYIQGNDWQ